MKDKEELKMDMMDFLSNEISFEELLLCSKISKKIRDKVFNYMAKTGGQRRAEFLSIKSEVEILQKKLDIEQRKPLSRPEGLLLIRRLKSIEYRIRLNLLYAESVDNGQQTLI